jgi:hypothetical protein
MAIPGRVCRNEIVEGLPYSHSVHVHADVWSLNSDRDLTVLGAGSAGRCRTIEQIL